MLKRIIIAMGLSLFFSLSFPVTASASLIPQDFGSNNGGALQWESDLFFFRLDYPVWMELLDEKQTEQEQQLTELSEALSETETQLEDLTEGPEKQLKILEKEELIKKQRQTREAILLYMAERAQTERDKMLLEEQTDRELMDPLIPRIEGYEAESEALMAEGYTMPATGKETSPFGWRIHPVTHARTLHEGIDLAGPADTPIHAARSGLVTFAGYNKISGNNILIRHYDGQETAYYHMRRLIAQRGQYVHQGEVIGLMGTTGRSTGNHLHFEIRINGVRVDPAPYIFRHRQWESH